MSTKRSPLDGLTRRASKVPLYGGVARSAGVVNYKCILFPSHHTRGYNYEFDMGYSPSLAEGVDCEPVRKTG